MVMIKLTDLLFEKVAHTKKSLEWVSMDYIPMNPKTMKQILGETPITAFHNMNWFSVKKQLGKVVMQFTQSVYTANKKFRIIQPSAIQEGKDQEINIPIYNDMGEAVGKSMDVTSMKFDVRVVSGSTLPINRWAYLEELKQLLQMGVVDDIAVLAETDIKNKEKIVKRKSL